MDLYKLVELLKKVRNEKLEYCIKLVNINDNAELIEKGVLFDDEHTCYYGYDKLGDIITELLKFSNTYGIYFEEEFIGIISISYQYYKDLSKLEISISLKKEYRNKNIGFCSINRILNAYFQTDIKSIHVVIREDNIKSRKLAEKCGFKEYPGYKSSNIFTDLDGNKIPQIQYLLTKKDYKKRK